MHPHFQKLFNNHKHTDFRVLEIIKQQQTMWHIYDPITWDEFNRATNGIKSTKVAVLNGVPPEEFKATDKYCRRYVFELINAFWHEKADFDNYHKSQCVPVPKSGRRLVRSGQVAKNDDEHHVQDIQLCNKCTLLLYIIFSWKSSNLVGRPRLVTDMASSISRIYWT